MDIRPYNYRVFGMGSWKNRYLVGFLTLATITSSGVVYAEQVYASKARATVARAHMSRARTLMVEALAEFEEARKYARPDMLIDSEDWRLRVISLTEQLNRVVDPKPRVTREGAVFRTPPRFIKRQKNQLPDVADSAKARSDIGERERLKKKQEERAQFFNNSVDPAKTNASVAKLPSDLNLPDEPVLDAPKVEKVEDQSVKNSEQGKNLFSNELMPNVGDENPMIAPGQVKDGAENSNNVASEEENSFMPDSSTVEQGALNVDGDPDEIDYDKKIEGQSEAAEPSDDDLLDSSDNPLLPPSERGKVNPDSKEKIGSESVPVLIDDDVDEVSSADVSKQFSEDEALAKKLEESITEKLTNR